MKSPQSILLTYYYTKPTLFLYLLLLLLWLIGANKHLNIINCFISSKDPVNFPFNIMILACAHSTLEFFDNSIRQFLNG